jgi:hypothetical protein
MQLDPNMRNDVLGIAESPRKTKNATRVGENAVPIEARPSRKAPPPEDSESVGISNDDESRQKTPSDIAAATKNATTDIYDPLLLGMSLLTPSMSISNPQNVSPQDATDVSVAQDSGDFSFDPSEADFQLDAFFGQGFDGGFDTDLSPSFFDPFVGGSFDQFVQPFGADETFTEGSFRVAPQSFEEPLHAQSPGWKYLLLMKPGTHDKTILRIENKSEQRTPLGSSSLKISGLDACRHEITSNY